MVTLNNSIIIIIWLILLTICYTDIRYRIISNYQVGAVFALIVINYLLGNGELHLINALICLLIGIVLFSINLIGAGDIKLIGTLLLSIPNYLVIDFITVIAIAGIPLALITLIKQIIVKRRITLPYGVAITVSYITISIFACLS